MKIVITDGFAVNPGDLSWDIFKQFGTLEIYRDTPNELAARRIGDADIAIINKTVIDEALLEQCPNLKLICVAATGYNVVDCAATKKRNIPVCNVPGYGTAAVAQFTFSLLLELCNRVGLHDRLVHEGAWGQRGGFCFWDTPQTELAGKVLGIIGYGTIGQAVGKIAEAFGMTVLCYNRSQKVRGASYVFLEELLQKSDIVSLHCPYTPEKARLIIREMTDLLTLDLVDKNLVTDQMVLTIGYDIDNLTGDTHYRGEIVTDHYGRKIPKHAHGTANLSRFTSSTTLITDAVIALYDQIVNPDLLVRRINLVANHITDERTAADANRYTQLNLFSDPIQQEAENTQLEREKRRQKAMLTIKKKYGKNAILKGMNLMEGATAKDRNSQIGGHKA